MTRTPRAGLPQAVVTALLLVACAGGDGTATTVGPTTTTPGAISTTAAVENTTTVPPTSTSPAGSTPTTESTSTSGTYPPACMEAVQALFTDLEPLVADFDFEGGDIDAYLDLLTVLVPPVTSLYQRYTEAQCEVAATLVSPDMEADLEMWVEREAPGALAFVEIVTMETPERGSDCQSYTGAMQGYVDRGGVFADLTPAEKFDVANLYAAITNWCALQTAGQYLGGEEVEAFLGIEVG